MTEGRREVNLERREYLENTFSILVLHCAKELYGNDAKSLKLTRMVKLVTFVADDVNFDLTWGWYKYGGFSKNAYLVAKDYSEGDLPSWDIPQERIEKSKEELRELLPSIEESIKNLKDYFTKDRNSFYEWVYGEKAPDQFRDFYKAHQSFYQQFRSILTSLRSLESYPAYFGEKFKSLESAISNYYNHMIHLDDDEILNLFCDFMDLFEEVMLRIKSMDYYIDSERLFFLGELFATYCGPKCDICTLLVPYGETVKGWRASKEKNWHKSNVELTKTLLPVIIDDLRKRAESLDLIPCIEELEAEIKNCDSKEERKTLRELYSEL